MKNPIIIPPAFLGIIIVLQIAVGILFKNFGINNLIIRLPIGIILFMFGFIVLSVSASVFKSRGTAIQWKESKKLIVDGFYTYSRNPMYIGMVLMILGVGIATGNIISILLVFPFYIYINQIVIPYEEEKMLNEFGDEYRKYLDKCRRWI